MSLRPARPEERAAIAAFLADHAPFAMFPLANLADHGMGGGHPRALDCWLDEAGGRLYGVLSVTGEGMVLPCLPEGGWAAAAGALGGRQVRGIIGPTDQVRGIEAAAGLCEGPRSLDADEPHFLLALADLAVPAGPGSLLPLDALDEVTLLGWRAAYHREVLGTPEAEIAARAADEILAWRRAGSHRVLFDGGEPLALTGFNAQGPGIVQVGGVYVPPDRRGQGLARRAVALHLAEARSRGATRATLFAANAAASRAYRAIGFREIGTWTLLIFRGAIPVAPS